jgi:hypothetical protein
MTLMYFTLSLLSTPLPYISLDPESLLMGHPHIRSKYRGWESFTMSQIQSPGYGSLHMKHSQGLKWSSITAKHYAGSLVPSPLETDTGLD